MKRRIMRPAAVRRDRPSVFLRPFSALAAAGLTVMTVGACAMETAGSEQPKAEAGLAAQDDQDEQLQDFAYVVRFEGIPGGSETGTLVRQVSEAERLVDQVPSSFSRLRRRAEGDLPRILQALRARAYYAAAVDVDIDRSTSPLTVTFRIEAGEAYDINKVEIEADPPSEDELTLPTPRRLDLESGKRAASNKIVDAEATLLELAKRQGFALARIGKRRIVVDHNEHTMDITLRVVPGRKVYFGETEVIGNEEVESRYVRRLQVWRPGRLITPERLDETERNLVESGLFNSVRIIPGTVADERGRVPIRIEVAEAKHRSIEASGRYRTDEGIGGSLGWEHRNLLGTGEQLGFELDGSQIGWKLSGEAREPDFIRRRQALVIGSEIEVEETEGFDSQSIGASVGIERTFRNGMGYGIGSAFTYSVVEQAGDEDKFGLISFPASFRWDHSDDLLDPSMGGRLSMQNEPFTDVIGRDITFNKSTVAYTRYLRLRKEKPRLILAARAKAGWLFGAPRSDVPADERFYAGGGGSVRGFGYQLAGELDEDNEPIGGRSLLEFAGEIRSTITDSIGIALFADSGAAFRSSFPDFEEPLHIGVGGGIRYFSPIGPIRFDVGVPLDRRSTDADDPFQFYVSIGQAF